jgi:hypothetical protein
MIRGIRVNRILFHFILDKEDERELRQLGRLRCNMRQCTRECVVVRVAVCGSAHGSVWQCAW